MRSHFKDSGKIIAGIATVGMAITVGIYYQYRKFQEAISFREKGNKSFRSDKSLEAVKYYTKSLAACPSYFCTELRIIIYKNRAAALEDLQRNEEALNDLNEILKYNPRHSGAIEKRSRVYENLKRYREALEDKFAFIYFNPSNLYKHSSKIKELIYWIASPEIDKYLQDSLKELQSDFYIKNFLKSFRNDPLLKSEDDAAMQESYLQCFELLKSGEYKESFQVVENALLSKPDVSEEVLSRLYLLRGTFYFLSCREDLALADFDLVIKNTCAKPSVTVNALIKRARVMLVNENHEEVENSFEKALEIDKRCPDIYYQRGWYFEKLKKFSKAAEMYDEALKLDPNYCFAEAHCLFCEHKSGDSSPSGLAEFDDLLEKFPDCLECKYIFVKVLISKRDFVKAGEVFTSMISGEQNSGPIRMLFAKLKAAQNKETIAKKTIKHAIKKEPNNPKLYYRFAKLRYETLDLKGAIEALEQAIKFAYNKKDLRKYIGSRETFLAQINVSNKFGIDLKDVVQHSRGTAAEEI